MLRLETKINDEILIERMSEQKDNILTPLLISKVPTYSNRIQETLAFMPRNHYLTLVSIHVPFRPLEDIGTIRFFLQKADGSWGLRALFETQKLSTPQDLIDYLKTQDIKLEIIDKRFCFTITDNALPKLHYKIELSARAAWSLGFEKTHYITQIGMKIFAERKNPPILTRYLQILCHNVGGTKHSNMTFPEAIAIYPLSARNLLYEPNIAINNRLEKGKVLDIEILDQDNQPFIHAPVYLEFYISEETEHEKKQGFFRLEKNTNIVLKEPISKLSIPYAIAFTRLKVPGDGFSITLKVRSEKQEEKIYITRLTLKQSILTRDTILQDIISWNKYISQKPSCSNGYIKPDFKDNILILTTNLEEVSFSDTYINIIAKQTDHQKEICFSKHNPIKIEIKPEYLYTQDQRLLIFCQEFSGVEPLAVARRKFANFEIINPNFWTWYKLEKPTNTLTFFYQLISNHGDGLITTVESLPDESDTIINLFYK